MEDRRMETGQDILRRHFSPEDLAQANTIPVGDVKTIGVKAREGESHEEAVARAYPRAYEYFGRDLLPMKEIEHKIQTTYRIDTVAKFTKALKEYDMLAPGDKVGVAISGGKDSLLLAKLFQILSRYSKIPFDVEFLAMDPGYAPINRELLEFNLAWLGIPATIYRSDVFEVTDSEEPKAPCYLCARMRRGFLYAKAQEMGCNKLALGHHYNDVIETTLLNVLFSGNFKVMMPKIVARNFENMDLLRPMILIKEEAIIRWRDGVGLKALDCACTVTQKSEGSRRKFVKGLIQELKKENPMVEDSIFRSGQNVAVDAILGYVNHGVHHSFLEHYGDQTWEPF